MLVTVDGFPVDRGTYWLWDDYIITCPSDPRVYRVFRKGHYRGADVPISLNEPTLLDALQCAAEHKETGRVKVLALRDFGEYFAAPEMEVGDTFWFLSEYPPDVCFFECVENHAHALRCTVCGVQIRDRMHYRLGGAGFGEPNGLHMACVLIV